MGGSLELVGSGSALTLSGSGYALPASGVVATAGFALFPFVMPSSVDPASSLTVWDAVSSRQAVDALRFTIAVSLVVALINAAAGTLIAWVLVRDEFPIVPHAKAITDAADRRDWPAVRQELDRTQNSVQQAMNVPAKAPAIVFAKQEPPAITTVPAAHATAAPSTIAEAAIPHSTPGMGTPRNSKRSERI